MQTQASSQAANTHPLDPLAGSELQRACEIVKRAHKGEQIMVKHCTLREPAKKLLVPFLNAERAGKSARRPPREADVLYFLLKSKDLIEAVVNLDTEEISQSTVEGHHAPLDRAEVNKAQESVRRSKEFLDVCKEFKVDPELICMATWPMGADNTEPAPRRVGFILYHRDPKTRHPESNQYAFPLPIMIVHNIWDDKVEEVRYCMTGGDDDGMEIKTGPKDTKHNRPSEYLPELTGYKPRELKPLHVSQPQGVSFSVDGNKIEWQKWRFRLGFNFREGPTLHDVCYDGRRVFYRLSLSEMNVPYGDPRPPLHLKQVFDFGDIGLGRCSNSLENGCDCLGSMRYFGWNDVDSAGSPVEFKNTVCVHEQDNGILWKHTNTPTGKAAVTRQRILVLQTIITVGNYDYIFAWHFDQAGGLHLESRATGILSTSPIDLGKKSKWGTVVGPGVLGPSHQHFISVRIDPAIDGDANTVLVDDVVAEPWGPSNPHGIGFKLDSKPIKTSSWADAEPLKSRAFKMVNPNVINPITMSPVGYKLIPPPSQMRLGLPDAMITSRAPFTQHHIWVTSYRDHELYAAGQYTNQSNGKAGGVGEMVARRDNVENTDIVVWNTFALTHVPRIEDYPVMPVETHTVSLKPCNFFLENPAMDVPLSTQSFNKSTYADQNNGGGGGCGDSCRCSAGGGDCCKAKL